MSCERIKAVGAGVIFLITAIIAIGMLVRGKQTKPSREDLREVATEISEQTGEAITHFGVLVDIRPNKDVLVSMRIKFRTNHKLIKSGVPIGIPTSHEIKKIVHPRKRSVDKVLLNDQPMEYELRSSSKVVSWIYPKNTEQLLPKGENKIEVYYKLSNALASLAGTRYSYELDFPFINSHIPVPVKQAVLTMRLPTTNSLQVVEPAGFLGTRAKRTGEIRSRIEPAKNSITFWPSRPLKPLEGMFASLKWQE